MIREAIYVVLALVIGAAIGYFGGYHITLARIHEEWEGPGLAGCKGGKKR